MFTTDSKVESRDVKKFVWQVKVLSHRIFGHLEVEM